MINLTVVANELNKINYNENYITPFLAIVIPFFIIIVIYLLNKKQ